MRLLPFVLTAIGLTTRIFQVPQERWASVLIALRLRTSDFGQYYTIAITTIFFYDFLLTLADEVSHVVNVPSPAFIDPPVKDQIRLAGKKIVGYVGRIARRTAFVDDPVVFAIFIVVRSTP